MESSSVTFAGTASLACGCCGVTTEFEQPPCPDGHGGECPEWYCTECGAATILGRPNRRRWSRARTRAAGAVRQPMARASSRS